MLMPTPPDAVALAAPAVQFLDRDHSILAFNERVLDWARRPDVPLLERLRFLCIVSSNLDEFFEVRTAPHLTAAQQGDNKGLYTAESFRALSAAAHDMVDRQYALYNDELLPAFQRQGIRIVSHGERNAHQRRWVKEYFEREVRPLLIPVWLDPSHPFPQVANKSLNFIVRLGGHDAFGRGNDIAIVKVPRVLPRLIHMPGRHAGKGSWSLEDGIGPGSRPVVENVLRSPHPEGLSGSASLYGDSLRFARAPCNRHRHATFPPTPLPPVGRAELTPSGMSSG